MSEQDLKDFLKPRKKRKSDDSYNKERRKKRADEKIRQKKLDDERDAGLLRQQKWYMKSKERENKEARDAKEKEQKDILSGLKARTVSQEEARSAALREQKWHQKAESRNFGEADKEKNRQALFESFESRLETKPAKSSFRIGVENVGKEAKNRLFTTSKREKMKSKKMQRKIWKKLI